MSIATKAGDLGRTSLMFNRVVSKCHPRIEACGGVDELNSAIGLARANMAHEMLNNSLEEIQKDLVALMGELATSDEDWPRYVQAGFARLTPENTARLDQLVATLEAQSDGFTGWATPGANRPAAALDWARVTCRRAERRVCVLAENQALKNAEILVYLNRLGDVLWLMARQAETAAPEAKTVKPV